LTHGAFSTVQSFPVLNQKIPSYFNGPLGSLIFQKLLMNDAWFCRSTTFDLFTLLLPTLESPLASPACGNAPVTQSAARPLDLAFCGIVGGFDRFVALPDVSINMQWRAVNVDSHSNGAGAASRSGGYSIAGDPRRWPYSLSPEIKPPNVIQFRENQRAWKILWLPTRR